MSKTLFWLVVLVAGVVAALPTSAQQPVVLSRNGYDPCLDQTLVTSIAITEGAASGNTEHVAVNGSDFIYFCGGSLQGGAAGTVLVRFGSGTACASNTVDVAAAKIVADGDGKLFLSYGTFRRSAAGRALCTNRSTSMTLVGELRYVRTPL
jgi:hypothetical protein